MENKVQELAQKIYTDGVEKAKEEAAKIIADAEKRRDLIINEAKAKAEQITREAKQAEQVTRQQTERDLRNLITNATDSLQASITNMLNSEAVKAGVDAALATPEALYKVIVEMCRTLFLQSGRGVEVSGEDALALEAYFQKEAKELLDKGVAIREVAGRSASFDIAPEGADYKVNVSKEAFAEYFKGFMRPRMQEILFGKEER